MWNRIVDNIVKSLDIDKGEWLEDIIILNIEIVLQLHLKRD